MSTLSGVNEGQHFLSNHECTIRAFLNRHVGLLSEILFASLVRHIEYLPTFGDFRGVLVVWNDRQYFLKLNVVLATLMNRQPRIVVVAK